MKAAVLVEKGKFEFREFPIPECGEHSVLVKMEACAVCNCTDTKLVSGKHALSAFPAIIGHEGLGTVAAVGNQVTKLKVGDRVLGGSFSCQEIPSLWGAYSQYGVADENAPIVPASIAPEAAALAFMLSEAVNAVRIADIHAEDNVLIIGAGAVGFSLLSVLKNTLHLKTIIVDLLDEKLKLASLLGADVVINSRTEDVAQRILEVTDGKGVTRVFEAVGNQVTYDLAFELIAPKGVIVPFGLVEGTLTIPFRKMYSKEVQIKWCKGDGLSAGECIENKKIALTLIEQGKIPTDKLITTVLPFERISEAFDNIAAGTEIRVILKI